MFTPQLIEYHMACPLRGLGESRLFYSLIWTSLLISFWLFSRTSVCSCITQVVQQQHRGVTGIMDHDVLSWRFASPFKFSHVYPSGALKRSCLDQSTSISLWQYLRNHQYNQQGQFLDIALWPIVSPKIQERKAGNSIRPTNPLDILKLGLTSYSGFRGARAETSAMQMSRWLGIITRL
jgi:hypothetical protein